MTNPCEVFTSGSLSSWEVSEKMSKGKTVSTSSDRLGCCSPNEVASNGYSSLSLHGDGGYRCSSYPSFSIDGRLLTPVHLDIDPNFQAMRQQEKEDIKLLNNQFVTLIEKVQCLEQQNKILTTRWNFLKDQENSHSESDIKAIYDQYMSKMNQEMKALNYEQENLESELTKVLSTMDNFRSK
ncbi:keratin, type II cytoskeletal 8-like [Antrostomus carolinensis]|uniref:keratin, type II cytoskeletal 8-like n=1 Tax=Antrostomus carolinensis TaxID=279965 RepID=UPI00052898CB|nr:keratin, type II cytoskeletal 8-like [Antrostomus carolinensis]